MNNSLCSRDHTSSNRSNDVESENNRIKRWLRKRYGCLKLGRYKQLDSDTILDMYEYVFRINIGTEIYWVMKALASITFNEVENQLPHECGIGLASAAVSEVSSSSSSSDKE